MNSKNQKGGIKMEVNNDNLEKALSNETQSEKTETETKTPEMPKEMEIGFHQGSLNTLAAERMELITMVQNVEKIMGMHVQRLEELGVKIQQKKE